MTELPQPRFDYAYMQTNSNEVVLVCPHCGYEYLHQSTVTVFDRKREDAPTVAIEVHGKNVRFLDDEHLPNPSGRRDGLAIRFDCEGCHFVGELTIAQHKGNTLVGWRWLDKPRRFSDDLARVDGRPRPDKATAPRFAIVGAREPNPDSSD